MCAIGLLGVMVSQQEIFERISMQGEVVDNVEFVDLSQGANLILSLIVIILCLTCLAVLFTWLTKLTMNKSILCTTVSSCFFMLLFISFMILGSVLVYPGTLGQQFIADNCARSQEGKFDEIGYFFRDLFHQAYLFDGDLHD